MSWARRPFHLRGHAGRRNLLLMGIGAVAALALLETVLLVLAAPPPQVTLEGAAVTYLDEGTTALGTPWFGGYEENYSGSADGYPTTMAAGSAFNLTVVIVNIDSHDHTILLATVAAPFHLVTVSPALPSVLDAEDDAALTLRVAAPGSAGSYVLEIALTAGS
jgi:hypothetical protein